MRYGIAILALFAAGFGPAPQATSALDAPALRGDAPAPAPAMIEWRRAGADGAVRCDNFAGRGGETRFAIGARDAYAFHDGLLVLRRANQSEIAFAHDMTGRVCRIETVTTAPVRIVSR
ncbi:MAG: hypothetical protein H2040_13925 [Euryhalocaulis sp.]|uniref:hypothetical protein n=1 Tax=Euryhalocaulis sp. TaxID=2744307 RepID=UPI0018172C1B|nr:hypothetical protein [Euryhalocaulis sp.]MBA4802950.1 hypothetical protein [Euryhalocaulis sp.]